MTSTSKRKGLAFIRRAYRRVRGALRYVFSSQRHVTDVEFEALKRAKTEQLKRENMERMLEDAVAKAVRQ
jgi:hypothetical protein